MYSYSTTSLLKLSTCHADLQTIMFEVIKHRDITIACGTRGKAEQDEAYHAGYRTEEVPKQQA